ncbi:translation initiation factor IF-2-like [Choloepus didactylus]|uniref:translation initiation factor IF-2-like n=1 Tax=Choloepus didactylus TaxID=27675 RepID=UPI0018A0D1EA|nr:translation initiation factor IF-2-like [Choloepus didactylus]
MREMRLVYPLALRTAQPRVPVDPVWRLCSPTPRVAAAARRRVRGQQLPARASGPDRRSLAPRACAPPLSVAPPPARTTGRPGGGGEGWGGPVGASLPHPRLSLGLLPQKKDFIGSPWVGPEGRACPPRSPSPACSPQDPRGSPSALLQPRAARKGRGLRGGNSPACEARVRRGGLPSPAVPLPSGSGPHAAGVGAHCRERSPPS